MFVRSVKDEEIMVGGLPYRVQAGKNILYPSAFPFDRGYKGLPCSSPLVSIHGQVVGVTTAADIWGQNIIRTLPIAAFTFAVSSSSANDVNTTGTGAQTVEVDCLDVNYIPYTVTINLNGQTKVTDTVLGATCFRINDIRVKSWGTGASNVGDIYVYDNSDTVTAGVPQTSTKIFHKIIATENVGRGGFYTVPAGYKMQTQQVRTGFADIITTARAGLVNLWFYKYRASGVSNPNMFPISGQLNNGGGFSVVNPDFPPIYDEKWDVTFHAAATVSSTISVYMDAILFPK